MPLVLLRFEKNLATHQQIKHIRDFIHDTVKKVFEVKNYVVEVRVDFFGVYDINHPPLAIEIITGPGRDGMKISQRKVYTETLMNSVLKSGLIPEDWLGMEKTYIWFRPGEFYFVPVGYPDQGSG